jgi:integrase/recombinase XerD
LTFEISLDRFCDDLKSNNFSPASLVSSRRHVLKFFNSIPDFDIKADVTAVKKEQILDFLAGIRKEKNKTTGKKLSWSYVCGINNTMKNYFNFLFREEIILHDYARLIKNPQRDKSIPKDILSVNEIDKLCQALDMKTLTGYRTRLAIEFMYNTGMRIAEVLNLEINDIDIQHKTVFVKGKGRKDRILPLTDTITEFVKEYTTKVRIHIPKFVKEEYLFLSNEGTRLHCNCINLELRKIKTLAGIKKPVTSHRLRHAFSVHLLQKGCDIKYISMMLGHTQLKTTTVYTKVEDKDLRAKLKKKHFYSAETEEGKKDALNFKDFMR